MTLPKGCQATTKELWLTAGSPAIASWHTVTVVLEAHEAANMTQRAATESEDMRLLQTLAKGQPLRPFARLIERQLGANGWPDWWTLAALGTAAVAMMTLMMSVAFIYCRFRRRDGHGPQHDEGGDPSE